MSLFQVTLIANAEPEWFVRFVAEIEVQMPSFRADVQSFLQFVGLRRSVMIYTDLEIVFKPLAADGLLL